MNKRISNIIAIGVIVISVIFMGLFFLANNKKMGINKHPEDNDSVLLKPITQDLDSIVNQKKLVSNITPDELVIARDLFNRNNLNIDYFWISRIKIKEENADNNYSANYIVSAIYIYNKLPVFLGGDVLLHFDNSKNLTYQSGLAHSDFSSINLNITPKISKEDAASLLIKKHPSFSSGQNLIAELGIANKKVGMGYRNPEFVLAWKITISGSGIPGAYVNAENGEVIYFDSGLRS